MDARGYITAALRDCTQAIQLNPENAAAYGNRGVQDCTHAIQLNPENPDPYINRGYAQFHLGQTKADQGDIVDAPIENRGVISGGTSRLYTSNTTEPRKCRRLR